MTRILVIDDDVQTRRLIVDWLTTSGFETLEAENGKDGLTPRDDLGIAPMFTGVAIIAISGGNPIYLSIAQKLGADLAVAKPFDPSDLLAAVGSLLKA